MRDPVTRGFVGLLSLLIMMGANAPEDDAFEATVRPVLADRCLKCHGAQKQSGGLRLDSREAILAGGDSGPAVAPGDPAGSALIRAIRHEGDVKMPPKAKIPDPAIEALTSWVKAGAPWPKGAIAANPSAEAAQTHWAFRPVRKPEPPAVKDAAWVATPVDAFILAALEAKGLTPSPKADKRTLIRRATFDLTGLPPTEAEIAAFEADASPGAFATVVGRLLASPRYGERWGRHWLDVARYADTKGYVFQEERRYPNAYTYRDYVIRAFNEDLPYDQFLVQQLAADRLPLKDDTRPLAAMGFLTLGRRFLNSQPDIIDDRIDVVSRGLLGLTVACARCHDHKFDPIPTEDYYSLYGVFDSSEEPGDPPTIAAAGSAPQAEDYRKESEARRQAVADFTRGKLDGVEDDLRKHAAAYVRAAAELGPGPRPDQGRVDALAKANDLPARRLRWFAGKWGKHLAKTRDAHDPIFAPWHALAALPADGFAAKAAELIKGWAEHPDPAKPVNPSIARALAEAPPASMKDVAARYGEALARADAARRDPPKDAPADPARDALAELLVADDGPFGITDEEGRRVLDRPDAQKRKELENKVAELDATHPGAPARAMVLRDAGNPHDTPIFLRGNPGRPGKVAPRRFLKVASPGPDRPPFQDGSGRLELARAIASKDNPLTARVMVNRIWMHHFGAGLVATPSDFGLRSDPPSHPELLDDLAARFVEGGWSVKAIHRLIMLSDTYQQRSDDRPDCRAVDPANRLLWKRNKRRLEFEAMRDSILAVAGDLDPTMGGRPVEIDAAPFSTRRTVYGFIDRQNLPGVFRTFDFATPDATSPRRFSTMVPQQALFLMNSPFVAEQARRLAARPEVAAPSNPEDRIRRLYGLALGRAPEPAEVALGVRFLESPASAPAPESGWIIGYGGVDEAAGRVVDFRPFPHWSGKAWQVGPELPHPESAFLNLAADGGHPGRDAQHSPIRRWVAPRDLAVAIEGTLRRPAEAGDGVRARVFGPAGVAGSWTLPHGEVATPVAHVEVKAGEAIDFVVDCLGNDNSDSFTWAPTIRALDGPPGRASWDARADFLGPPPEPLTPLEAYAQVLLLTNEFVYAD